MQNRGESERFRAWGNRVAWAFVPYVAACQAVQLAFHVPGVPWLTFEVFALMLVVGVTSPWWARRWRELNKTSLGLAAAFSLMVLYGLGSLAFHGPAEVTGPDGGPVPRLYMLFPLLNAGMAMIAGYGVVLAAERKHRLRIFAWAGAAALLVAFVGWPFQSAYRGYVRLATGQGGAAIIHVVFLLIASLGLAQYIRGWRPKLSLAIALGGFGALLATQSRGALVNVGAWLALIVVGWLISHPRDLRRLWPVGAALGVGALAIPFIPGLDRILSLYDPKRATNLDTALELWGENGQTMFFGLGPGQVWPWPAFESGLYSMPDEGYAGYMSTEAGNVLLTPHSTPLAMLVELGIPGALLGLIMGALMLRGWWRSRTTLPRLVVASASLACLVAFLVDTYLLRNFGISLWWWATIALVATWDYDAEPAPELAPAGVQVAT